METLRIAICEDDIAEQQRLLQMIVQNSYTTDVNIFSNGEDFLAAFKPGQYDLILMDIFMDGITGVQTITKLRTLDNQVPVAFITSSKDFTLESYRLNALKYIEKPASKKDVDEALQLASLKQQSVEKLILRIHGVDTAYPLPSVMYLEQAGRTVSLHLLDGSIVCANKKLSELEPLLLDKGFLRCHKSYLVNMALIRGLDRDLCTFEMVDGGKVYIRKRGFWEVQRAFEAYLFATELEASHG